MWCWSEMVEYGRCWRTAPPRPAYWYLVGPFDCIPHCVERDSFSVESATRPALLSLLSLHLKISKYIIRMMTQRSIIACNSNLHLDCPVRPSAVGTFYDTPPCRCRVSCLCISQMPSHSPTSYPDWWFSCSWLPKRWANKRWFRSLATWFCHLREGLQWTFDPESELVKFGCLVCDFFSFPPYIQWTSMTFPGWVFQTSEASGAWPSCRKRLDKVVSYMFPAMIHRFNTIQLENS